jgi:hypothetical protein
MENKLDNSKCPISKLPSLIKFSLIQFLKSYCLRALLGLFKYLILQKGYKSLNILKLLSTIFNTTNLRTGLFLSLMPFLYELINIFFNPHRRKLITFLAGFISSLIGVVISENNDFMTFVILSVFTRSLHAAIQVILTENGYSTENRLLSYSGFWAASAAFLFITYFHPSFKPIQKLVLTYACPYGNELKEFTDIGEGLRLV